MNRIKQYFREASRSIGTALTVLSIVMSAWPATAQVLARSSNAPMPASEAFEISGVDQVDGARILPWERAEGYFLYRDHLAVKNW